MHFIRDSQETLGLEQNFLFRPFGDFRVLYRSLNNAALPLDGSGYRDGIIVPDFLSHKHDVYFNTVQKAPWYYSPYGRNLPGERRLAAYRLLNYCSDCKR